MAMTTSATRASATTPICAGGATPSASASAASAAPSKPPTLKSAWKLDMIGRAKRPSTATASVLMAISIAPMLAPNIGSRRKRSGATGTSISSGRAAQKTNAATPITIRLPRRATSGAPPRSATTEPRAMRSRPRPRVASLNPNRCLMKGTCAAHDAIPTPFNRNNAERATRVARRPALVPPCARTTLPIRIAPIVYPSGTIAAPWKGASGHSQRGLRRYRRTGHCSGNGRDTPPRDRADTIPTTRTKHAPTPQG